jgi:hypothetical protein
MSKRFYAAIMIVCVATPFAAMANPFTPDGGIAFYIGKCQATQFGRPIPCGGYVGIRAQELEGISIIFYLDKIDVELEGTFKSRPDVALQKNVATEDAIVSFIKVYNKNRHHVPGGKKIIAQGSISGLCKFIFKRSGAKIALREISCRHQGNRLGRDINVPNSLMIRNLQPQANH